MLITSVFRQCEVNLSTIQNRKKPEMVNKETSKLYSLKPFILDKTTPLPNYTRTLERLRRLYSQGTAR